MSTLLDLPRPPRKGVAGTLGLGTTKKDGNMSHYHLEVIMPPTDDLEAVLSEVLHEFNARWEPSDDEEAYDINPHSFWDWWVLGGRFSGSKIMDTFDAKKKKAFFDEIQSEKVTVSSLVCGKESIQPESQIPKVDAIFKKHFPKAPFEHCPFFQHAGRDLSGDVLKVSELTKDMTAYMVLICSQGSYKDGRKYWRKYRLDSEYWNGSTFQKTDWGGGILDAIERYNSESKKDPIPGNWISVTVDFHN